MQGESVDEDNVVMIGGDVELLRVEPEEKYCEVREVPGALALLLPSNGEDIRARRWREEIAISCSRPAQQTTSSSRLGGENFSEDERGVGETQGGDTGSVTRIVKPQRSVTMAGHKNILLHINGEDSPIISGGDRAGCIVKSEINHVELSLHCSDV